jgi:hypothetical protein
VFAEVAEAPRSLLGDRGVVMQCGHHLIISSGRVFESKTISGISDSICNEICYTDVTGLSRCVVIFFARQSKVFRVKVLGLG